MQFEEILKPYSEDGRSVEGQLFWLSRKGLFTDDIIDRAVLNTYREIREGKTFETGHALDRYLYEKCCEFSRDKMKSRKEKLQEIFTLANPVIKKSWWKRIFKK